MTTTSIIGTIGAPMSLKGRAREALSRATIALSRHPKWRQCAVILATGETHLGTVGTACTDGWACTYDPAFLDALTPQQVRFVVLHEKLGHVAHRHLKVWAHLFEENPRLANIAADIVVNTMILKHDDGEEFVVMPDGGVPPNMEWADLSVGDIFQKLKQQAQEQGNDGEPQEGECQADSDSSGGSGGEPGQGRQAGHDAHDWEGAKRRQAGQTPEEVAAQDRQIDDALRSGARIAAQLRGQGAGGADALLGDLLKPRLDPYQMLRDWLTEQAPGFDDANWARPNKRMLSAADIYMPTYLSRTLDTLVIGMDTSGSCWYGETRDRFVSELTNIITSLAPTTVHVVYWDWEIQGHQTFEDGQFAVQNLRPRGGGGTDGAVLFDYLREQRIAPDAIVQFTDGEVGDWGQSNWPTCWVVTGSYTAPFGVTINLKV